MQMLFFSSDSSEVELASRECSGAGIACEVRTPVPPPAANLQREAELWIRNDSDCHRALMLFVQLGIGFSKRSMSPVEDPLETEAGPLWAQE